MGKPRCSSRWLTMLVAIAVPLGLTRTARASDGPDWRRYEAEYAPIPSFSRQTGLTCNVCHTAFPQLTAFGRLFKLNGYTLTGLQTVQTAGEQPSLKIDLIPPVSAMVQASGTVTQAAEPGKQNANVQLPQELSVFLGEEISPRLGTFIQITYDPEAGSLALDNTDLRFASHTKLASRDLIFGLTLNNNPTVQDVWNTTPAWGFPFASSGIAPAPSAAPLIADALAQQVAGLGAYGLWNGLVYGELSAYRSAPQGAPPAPDSASSNTIHGVAPYWRLALQHAWGTRYLEVGTYGIEAKIYPTGIAGLTDRYTDIGVDGQYEQPLLGGNFTLYGTWIHERQHLDATFDAGGSDNSFDRLNTVKVNATAYTKARVGGTLGYFSTTGDADAALRPAEAVGGSANGSPNSDGAIAELDWMPWLNTRLAVQYVWYDKFNGGKTGYDGFGRKASDNNALYLLAWFAF